MIATLDTNVLVSALLSPFGTTARVLDLVLLGEIQSAFDDRLLEEYRRVLGRSKFPFTSEQIANLLAVVERNGIYVTALPLDVRLPDSTDLPFLEVAATAGAVLVTGNLRHFPTGQRAGVRVQTPADVVAALAQHRRSDIP